MDFWNYYSYSISQIDTENYRMSQSEEDLCQEFFDLFDLVRR